MLIKKLQNYHQGNRADGKEGKVTYYAVNGQEIADAMIARWRESYEQGEFPEGERSTGKAIYGRTPLSADKTTTTDGAGSKQG